MAADAGTPSEPSELGLNAHARQSQALVRLKQGVPNAEWEVLEEFSRLHRSGELTPLFQKVVNALLAKAVRTGQLPPRPKGRRKQSHRKGLEITAEYLDRVDDGERSVDVVQDLSDRYHVSDRHILRIVAEEKWWFGGDDEHERQLWRARREKLRHAFSKAPAPPPYDGRFDDLNDPITGLFGLDRYIASLLDTLNDVNDIK